MYGETRYLAWAIQRYATLQHDIASSGIRTCPFAELFGDGTSVASFASIDEARVLRSLNERIATFVGRAENEVTPALGTSHALWGAYAALLSPGDEVIVESPVYEPLVRGPEAMGAKVVYTERRAENKWQLDVNDIRSRFSDKTRAVSITNLHNPTGAHTSDETIAELARVCAERDAHLIVDEVYAPFASGLFADGSSAKGDTWPGTARRLGDNVVAIASLTKVYGAGPHRVGWILADEEVTQRARNAMLTNVGHLPWSHAAIACAAIERVPSLVARTRRELGKKREAVAAFMASFPAWKYSAPAHGLFGFAWSPGKKDLRADIEAWNAKTGALVVPGSFFGMESGFRIGWSLPEEKLQPALEKLALLLAP